MPLRGCQYLAEIFELEGTEGTREKYSDNELLLSVLSHFGKPVSSVHCLDAGSRETQIELNSFFEVRNVGNELYLRDVCVCVSIGEGGGVGGRAKVSTWITNE